uniref:Uncharacterized protein n=1 Tax=Arcella intermedia TaxID=1963864 RepID=A0A6B2LM07_9EUKA
MVYDVTSLESFASLSKWTKDIRQWGHFSSNMIVVGNKCDLWAKRKVTTEQGQKWAQINGALLFLETSAKDGSNVSEAFEHIANIIYNKARRN